MKLNINEDVDNISIIKTWDDYFTNDKFEDQPCDYHGYDIMFNGKKVGSTEIIDYFNEYNDICYVERIDIDKNYRGLGIGTKILTEEFRGEGYSDIVVAPDNEDARRLYQRIGEETNYVSGCDIDFGNFDQGYGVFVI